MNLNQLRLLKIFRVLLSLCGLVLLLLFLFASRSPHARDIEKDRGISPERDRFRDKFLRDVIGEHAHDGTSTHTLRTKHAHGTSTTTHPAAAAPAVSEPPSRPKKNSCPECRSVYWTNYRELFTGPHLYKLAPSTDAGATRLVVLPPAPSTGFCSFTMPSRPSNSSAEHVQLSLVFRRLTRDPALQTPRAQEALLPAWVRLLPGGPAPPQPLPALSAQECRQWLDLASTHLRQPPAHPLLLVVTTSNQLRFTVQCIQALERISDPFDVLVVDDCSSDGTVSYLRRRGYAVLSKRRPRGLTHSWNMGYRFAMLNGYTQMVFANNDVEVPAGAMIMLSRALGVPGATVVVPLTSRLGAGHNPGQDVLLVHRQALLGFLRKHPLPPLNNSVLDAYVEDASHCQAIQSALCHKFDEIFEKNASLGVGREEDHSASDAYLQQFMPVSSWKNKVKFNGFFFAVNLPNTRAAAYSPLHLFDPGNVMVGQEDSLTLRLQALGLPPPRLCLHAFVHHAKSATVKASGYDVTRGSDQTENRNNLTLYHHIAENQSGEAQAATPLWQYFSASHLPRPLSTCPDMSSSGRFFPQLFAPFVSLAGACSPVVAPVRAHSSTPIVNSSNQDNVQACSGSVVTVGMAISDPAKTPTAGDIFTAQELAINLQLLFQVRVVFLRRGVSWYDLRGVDVLLTFLDAYDLSRLRNEEPHLVKVAWMRNWFHRWMSRPWLGNYDMLLASSGVAKRFFDESVNGLGGVVVSCHKRCPPALSLASPLAPRVKLIVPVEELRIATNPQRFLLSSQPEPPLNASSPLFPSFESSRQTVDYVFTGNYWNHSRDIMAHLKPGSPALVPYHGWVVGSGWLGAFESGLLMPECGEMLRPSVPYSRLPEVYAAAKVVLDDNNHVTKLWGSVNSRVFDALAMGVLVISNGVAGSDDTFRSQLPTYASSPGAHGDDLSTILSFYLQHDSARHALSHHLQQEVLSKHTYRIRAQEFVTKINAATTNTVENSFIVKHTEKCVREASASADFQRHLSVHTSRVASGGGKEHNGSIGGQHQVPAICIGVRTHPGQALMSLDILLRSLMLQWSSSELRDRVILHAYVVDTDITSSSVDSQQRHQQLQAVIDGVNLALLQTSREVVAGGHISPDPDVSSLAVLFQTASGQTRRGKNVMYGYDESEPLLQYLMQQKQCAFVMFTNGDNIYNSAWFDRIVPVIVNPLMAIVAWDFVSHHPQKSSGMRRQRVSVRLERGHVDLGSVMLRTTALQEANASFLPHGMFTTDLFARDYFLVRQVLESLSQKQEEISAASSPLNGTFASVDKLKADNASSLLFPFPTSADLLISHQHVQLIREVLLFHQ